METLHTFLARHPPFRDLADDALSRLIEAASLQSVPAGATVLLEDAAPATVLYVVRSGAVELLHQGEVIDVLEPGEVFGHPSLLTGMAPTFTVRAHEPTELVLIPRDEALAVLSRPVGVGFVAETLRDRLVQTGHTVHGLPPIGTIPVADLLPGRTVSCPASVTIRSAAARMTAERVSALLVRSGEPLLVTDADIRAKSVAGDISPENPVLRIAQPALVVEPARLAVDVVVDMLDRGVDHVLVADGDQVLGIVSATDLLGLEQRSPFALRHAVLRADSEDEVVEAAGRLPDLLLALMGAGLDPPDVGRVLTLQLDTITQRLLDLALARHGPAPCTWAWLAFGSAARRELTLGSDQEHGLAYAETDTEVDAYFAALTADVVAGLGRCGFPADVNNVLASDPNWRMPGSGWRETVEDCLRTPDRSRLIRATVAFDFRHVTGGLAVTPTLVPLLRTASRHPDFVRRLARTATDFKPPLGFRGSIATGHGDAPPGTFDIKRGGMIPVVNLARFHALANGVTISATLDRLSSIEELGAVPASEATTLREAFEIAWRIRLEHHSRCLVDGRPLDNFVDLDELQPLQRHAIREAFRAVAAGQKRLGVYVPAGL